MSTLKLNDLTGDLEITDNSLTLLVERDEIRQRILNRIKTFLGEWFLDTTIGVPYHQIIFIKGVAPSTIDDVIKLSILAIEGVTRLTRFVPLDLTDRVLNVDFQVDTDFGEVSISERIA